MTEPFIFLRTVVPMVVAFNCAVALGFLHEQIKPPERGFLIWFWGCLGLVFLEAVVVSFFLRLAEPATITAGNAGFDAALGVLAALLLALTVVLGRWIRVAGQPILSVLFRPPPGLTPRAARMGKGVRSRRHALLRDRDWSLHRNVRADELAAIAGGAVGRRVKGARA